MNVKHLLVGLAGLVGVAANASAATADLGTFTLDYDDSTILGGLSFSFSSGGNVVGFGWNLPSSLAVAGGAGTTQTFALPSFTVTAKAGNTLSGPASGFLGNLVFGEYSGATTSASGSAMVSFDGGPAVTAGGALAKTTTTSLTGFNGGYFSGTADAPIASFVTFAVTNASLTLSVDGPGFGSIISQPQNELKFSFLSTPVPVPAAVWLLASALGAMGTITRRRV
jgi:hypothetical protein